ncbi:hypothetical protein [Actinomycetospora flava]|uniref:Uncharacterized protein n=1 Tax=Actinomycetospora flava TaxID=3129232 RepID=A0ABU8MF84_9PSEU
MDFRRLPVLAGPVLAGLLVLGGCAGAPETPAAAPSPAAVSAPTGAGGQAPCTTRLRPGGATGGGGLTLTPEVQAEIERLRQVPGAGAEATPPNPELASRLAEVGARVERAAQPCADR